MLLATIAISFMFPFAVLGAFVFVKTILLPMKAPADTSNRIAHLRLVWWAINAPEKFVDTFPWLTRDEAENLK
jgi:hypothetical protein